MASQSPKETGRTRCASERSGPWARPGISELLGFQGRLGILPGAHTLKVVYIEASEEESVKEVVAKDFERFPLIFGLHVYRNIVEPVPEKRKIKLTAIVLCMFTCSGVRGIYYLGFESKIAGFHLSRSEGAKFGQGI